MTSSIYTLSSFKHELDNIDLQFLLNHQGSFFYVVIVNHQLNHQFIGIRLAVFIH